MSRGEDKALPPHISFPRVSGDEPGGTITINATNEFSPRERG